MTSKLEKEKQSRDRCLPVPNLAHRIFQTKIDYYVTFNYYDTDHAGEVSYSVDTTAPNNYLKRKIRKQWDMEWWDYEVVGYQPATKETSPYRQQFSLLGLVLRKEKMAVITTKIDLEKKTKMLYVPTTGVPDEVYFNEEHFLWGTVLERNFLPKEQALQIALHYLRHYQWPETALNKKNETVPIQWEERPFTMWYWENGRLHKTMDI